ncbi:hypothetical protein H632_c557p1 [Helicosporidium sp. ATCC 50920]|nr:hypothetical protein H632_c557p1 [Helicosporidium sp. ATCC 50920]|eukprot:KDD75675.1 hypothetical protein H632_c557p1 [Helicosporidium sp. ATCC 50920]
MRILSSRCKMTEMNHLKHSGSSDKFIVNKKDAIPTQGLGNVVDSVSASLDGAVDSMSGSLRGATAAAGAQVGEALAHAQGYVDQGRGTLAGLEAQAFGLLKEGVRTAYEHQEATAAVALAAAAVLLPGPRRLLWRMTLGRLQSPEAGLRSAEQRAKALSEAVTFQKQEVSKLQERVALAQAEYERGRNKLEASAEELAKLSRRMRRAHEGAAELQDDLRRMRLPQSVPLRSAVAQHASTAEGQRKVVERMILDLARQGI